MYVWLIANGNQKKTWWVIRSVLYRIHPYSRAAPSLLRSSTSYIHMLKHDGYPHGHPNHHHPHHPLLHNNAGHTGKFFRFSIAPPSSTSIPQVSKSSCRFGITYSVWRTSEIKGEEGKGWFGFSFFFWRGACFWMDDHLGGSYTILVSSKNIIACDIIAFVASII